VRDWVTVPVDCDETLEESVCEVVVILPDWVNERETVWSVVDVRPPCVSSVDVVLATSLRTLDLIPMVVITEVWVITLDIVTFSVQFLPVNASGQVQV
jgi:hypothetical protein